MKLSSLLSAISLSPIGQDNEISSVITDSRKAEGGALFVAICGATADGHSFLMSCYEKGVRDFVCEKEASLPKDANVYYVDDTKKALSLLSAEFYMRPADKIKVVGITGTKGKTTTALFLHSILEKNGIRSGYIGTSGIIYGACRIPTVNTTPDALTLQKTLYDMQNAGCKYCILEVSSQALYQHRVYGIDFFVRAFTNLSPDHIGGVEHPTFEHYKACKVSLFTEYNADYSVINADSEHSAAFFPKNGSFISVSSREGADLSYSVSNEPSDKLISKAALIASGNKYELAINLPGDFNIQNAVMAVALASLCGVSVSSSIASLKDIYIEGRFEAVPLSSDRQFIIDYSHNGVSVKNALSTVRTKAKGRVICLIGSVGERTKNRRREIGEVLSSGADIAILTADNSGTEDTASICREIASHISPPCQYKILPDREEAIKYAIEISRENDIILLAGKGHERYQLIGKEKVPFCEKDILLANKELLGSDTFIPDSAEILI